MKCKITNKQIKPFMSFGKMPIANGFIEKKDFESEFFFDMEIGFSEDISLLQLKEHPTPEQMFNDNYPFFTGSSEYMKMHFSKYAKFIKDNYLNNNSKIIEIGSNDGTFLKNFKDSNLEYVGFEPSSNVAEIANNNNVKTLNNFFNQDSIEQVAEFKNKTDVIYAANVICHIPNLPDLIKSVDKLLSKNGVFIFEEPYLGSMFEKISYDQIYDEHIFMFSASSVSKIFQRYNFHLIDSIPQVTHGGSMRYVLKRKKNESGKDLKKIFDYEKNKKLNKLDSCINFKKNCEISKEKIVEKIKFFKENGKSICGYAATSKSTTILNYCKIGTNYIDYICDTTKEKIGKFSPGMHIPIKDMNFFHNNMRDCVYLFAWNHKDEIFNKEKNFKGEWFSHVAL